MRKALVGPDARMLNHAEFVYGPGDRARTRRLFEAFGARVLDPQTDPIPEAVGPAAAPYLIIYFDGEADDPFDNVAYASEVQAPQRAFEEVLRARFDTDPELAMDTYTALLAWKPPALRGARKAGAEFAAAGM